MSAGNLQTNEQGEGRALAVETLSEVGRKVVQGLTDPRCFGQSVDWRAKFVGVSRAQFYRLRDNQDVLEAVRQATDNNVQHHLPAVLNAAIKSAMIPGKDGFADRKMLLEIGGLYSRYNPRKAEEDPDQKKAGKEFGKGLVEALNDAQRKSADMAQKITQSDGVGFDGGVEVIEADWQSEPTTSSVSDLSEEAEIT